MKIMDNINTLLGDDLKASIRPKAKLKIAASCFSIYAYEALKSELKKIESVEFILTSPAFVPNEVTDKLEKEHGDLAGVPNGLHAVVPAKPVVVCFPA